MFLSDLTDININNYTTATYGDFFDERVAALSVGVKNEIIQFQGLPDWLKDTKYFNPDNVRIWYNTDVLHNVPAYLNVFSNAQYRAASNKSPDKLGLTVYNQPLTATDSDSADAQILATLILDTILALSTIFSLSFLPASFILILVDEKELGAKHLHLVAGLQQFPFWLANWLWDFCLYFIAAICTFLIFLAFQEESFVAAPNWLGFLLLLIFYGWAVIPLEYPFYRLFSNSASAYVAMLALNIMLGIGLVSLIFVLDFLGQDNDQIEDAYNILSWVLLIVPHFAFGQGMIAMGQNYAEYEFYKTYDPDYPLTSPLTFDVIGKNILFLFLEGIVFFAFVVIFEGGWTINGTMCVTKIPFSTSFYSTFLSCSNTTWRNQVYQEHSQAKRSKTKTLTYKLNGKMSIKAIQIKCSLSTALIKLLKDRLNRKPRNSIPQFALKAAVSIQCVAAVVIVSKTTIKLP